MQVYKFGGASLRDAHHIKQVVEIIRKHGKTPLLVIVSAIGNTTDQLEAITEAYFHRKENTHNLFKGIKAQYHTLLLHLFQNNAHPIFDEIANLFVEIDWVLEEEPLDQYDYLFDQIVSIGELLSSKIVHACLAEQKTGTKWIDARNYIQTDNTYREALVNWEQTAAKITTDLPTILQQGVIITQGFIGSTSENFTTTLGREGSDYSAAIFGASLDAETVTIWKDVPGVLNADPKWFENTRLIPELSYRDAIELTYYGATVIHPKTIKPLQNKSINLIVRSFLDQENPGTTISAIDNTLPVPSFIFKVNQVQIAILPKDFSFIVEDNFSQIFNHFAKHRLKINLMHNSAVCFSVSVDYDEDRLVALIKEIKRDYDVEIQRGLELITIRYYNEQTIKRVLENKEVILELRDTYTCQLLVKPIKAA